MSEKLVSEVVSRRTVLRSAFGLMTAALTRFGVGQRAGFSVALIVPPHWLKEAHEVIRRVHAPRIPDSTLRLSPDSEGDQREKIQAALDQTSAGGGGRVLLAPGVWRVDGPIRLRSCVELHLEEGAEVVFSEDRELYLPPVLTRWEGTDLYGYSPCVYALDVHDVAITGRGSLSMANGGEMGVWRLEQTEAQKRLRAMGAAGTPLAKRVFGSGSFLRPSFIQFLRCERVLVEGVGITDFPFWGIHLLYSHHAVVRGVRVASHKVNNDGVDIDSSSHVVVEQCIFSTGDDCIAVKSGRDLDGRTVGQPSEDIVIRDCHMVRGKSSGLAIGSEMSGGVRRVYLFRCDFGSVETVVNIKSNLDRGGFVTGIRAWNLSVKKCDRLMQVTTSYHGYAGGNFPPRFEDIELDDIQCDSAEEALIIKGVPASPVRRIAIKNVRVERAKTAGSIVGAEKVRCEKVEINKRPVVAGCL